MHGDATEIGLSSFDTQHAYSVSSRTDCSSTLVGISALQLRPCYLPHTFPDIRLEACGRYNLYEIGFLTVSGCLCMTRFQ